MGLLVGFSQPAIAVPPLSSARSNPLEASTSDAARRSAIRSIPLDQLTASDRAKVASVVSTATVFRRLPVRSVACDSELYVFLIRHPDVVVGIWEAMKISQLQLRQVGEGQFRLVETVGATALCRLIYQSRNLHVLYAEGTYQGPWAARPVKGRVVLALKTGYAEQKGRHYVTSRMDCFLSVEPSAAELVTKAISPLAGKTVDNNFLQTLAFLGSLSRTAEVNNQGVQRVALQLKHVQPEVRIQFAELSERVARRHAESPADKEASQSEVARRPGEHNER
jgi:hypothetical protein